MPNQISNTEQLAYIAETTWGTTPATPIGQLMRFTGFTPMQDKITVKSTEITNSREIADIIQTSAKGGITIPFELSYDVQFEDILQALLGGTWSTNVLKVGTTRKSFTIQRAMSDITQYQLFTGAVPSSLTLTAGMSKIIAGSTTFVSKFPSMSGSSVWSSTTAAGSNPIMDPIAAIQLVQEGGAGAIAGATEFSMTLNNGLINFDQLSSKDPLDIQLGAIDASGTFIAYMPDLTYWTKFAAHTTTSLNFTLGGASSKKYAFQFSKVKLSKVDLVNPGMNNPLLQKFTWEAFKDATNSTVMVTRTP